MDRPLIPVILAGGKGERFWPLSRRERPKQFLSLDGSGKTLLQSTAHRLLPLAGDWQNLWVVTSAQLAAEVQKQLPQLPGENIIVEPEGRDTAPAVTWTALQLKKRYPPDTVIGLFPADHWIGDEPAFQNTIKAAVRLAEADGSIVTLGMQPTYPATGYGYIEQGDPIGRFGNAIAHRISRFTEKPDYHTAAGFLYSGRFSWNSGMFLFQLGAIIQQLHIYAPDIIEPLEEEGIAAYELMPKISIDYALMEKTSSAYVLPSAFGWDDLGDWNSLDRLLKGDQPNVVKGNHVGQDTYRTILYASNEEDVIVTIGLEDVVVVRDRNVTLIVRKDRTQEIKQILKRLQDDPKLEKLL